MKQTVNLAFALMGILFCVCLTIANILEVKIVSVGSLTMTGGLIVFPISYIINDVWPKCGAIVKLVCLFGRDLPRIL